MCVVVGVDVGEIVWGWGMKVGDGCECDGDGDGDDVGDDVVEDVSGWCVLLCVCVGVVGDGGGILRRVVCG